MKPSLFRATSGTRGSPLVLSPGSRQCLYFHRWIDHGVQCIQLGAGFEISNVSGAHGSSLAPTRGRAPTKRPDCGRGSPGLAWPIDRQRHSGSAQWLVFPRTKRRPPTCRASQRPQMSTFKAVLLRERATFSFRARTGSHMRLRPASIPQRFHGSFWPPPRDLLKDGHRSHLCTASRRLLVGGDLLHPFELESRRFQCGRFQWHFPDLLSTDELSPFDVGCHWGTQCRLFDSCPKSWPTLRVFFLTMGRHPSP